MVFQSKPVATIKARDATDSDVVHSMPGVTRGNTTLENAAAQINKILDVVGKEVSVSGMQRVIIEEGVEE